MQTLSEYGQNLRYEPNNFHCSSSLAAGCSLLTCSRGHWPPSILLHHFTIFCNIFVSSSLTPTGEREKRYPPSEKIATTDRRGAARWREGVRRKAHKRLLLVTLPHSKLGVSGGKVNGEAAVVGETPYLSCGSWFDSPQLSCRKEARGRRW
nr:hypothetical protein Iba_chr08aCG12660 [Ipomoea batatas]